METQIIPQLSTEQVLSIARHALQKDNWLYDSEFGLQPTWRGLTDNVIGREGQKTFLWIVSFLTPPGPFEPETRFVEIDDETASPLGIMTGHNYFFL